MDFVWTNKQDGIDDILAEDINTLAKYIIDLDSKIANAYEVFEYDTISELPIKGEQNTLYIVKDVNKIYRWGTDQYIPLSSELNVEIGDNGNWYIDGKDTGKPSRGERGYSGLVPKQTKIPTRVTNVEPNIMYEFEETTTDVEIFLGEPLSGYDNEWDFVITQGTTAYEIILPTIKWGLGIAPTFSANSTTICRLYYIGNTLCGEWVTV